TVDFLRLPRGRQGDVLRGFYRMMVGRAPAAYGLAMRQWERHPGFFEWLTTVGAGGYERPLATVVDRFAPHVVVSTYNLAAQALGRLRMRGRIVAPVVSYVTDPGAHPYWVAAGADRHLATLPETAVALRAYGAGSVATVRPLVDVPPATATTRLAARRRWQLPADARVVLVNAGSWGVGGV